MTMLQMSMYPIRCATRRACARTSSTPVCPTDFPGPFFPSRRRSRALQKRSFLPLLLPSPARPRHIEMSSAASGPISPLAAVSRAVSLPPRSYANSTHVFPYTPPHRLSQTPSSARRYQSTTPGYATQASMASRRRRKRLLILLGLLALLTLLTVRSLIQPLLNLSTLVCLV